MVLRAEPSFLIRKADLTDADGILACLGAAFGEYRNQYTAKAFADTVVGPAAIQHRMAELCLFVAVSETKIVGTIGCDAKGDTGHLRGMAVLPEWRGTGVASALLKKAEAALQKSACRWVTLDTTEPLKRAIRFYQQHGFAASGRVSDFFGMRLYEYRKPL